MVSLSSIRGIYKHGVGLDVNTSSSNPPGMRADFGTPLITEP